MYTFKLLNNGVMAGNILLLLKALYVKNKYKVIHTVFFSQKILYNCRLCRGVPSVPIAHKSMLQTLDYEISADGMKLFQMSGSDLFWDTYF
jgi:hypothetical protein